MELLFIKQCSCPVVMSSLNHYCWGSMLIPWISFWSHSRQQKLWPRVSWPASASAKLQSLWGYKDLAITINVILLQCTIHGLPLETIQKLQLFQNVMGNLFDCAHHHKGIIPVHKIPNRGAYAVLCTNFGFSGIASRLYAQSLGLLNFTVYGTASEVH